jgi:hypothetical protein
MSSMSCPQCPHVLIIGTVMRPQSTPAYGSTTRKDKLPEGIKEPLNSLLGG